MKCVWLDLFTLARAAWLAAALVALAAPCAQAKTYFVATGGSDANPGAAERPFRSIQRAAKVMQPGDTCLVRGGLYRETVRPARSGEEGKPITFAAYGGESVVVSGADPISGWRPWEGHIYSAQTDLVFEQLFVDGRMMNLARWPNAPLDPMRPAWAVAGKGTGANRIVDPKLPEADLNGAVMHILPGAHWVSWTRPIREYDARAHAFQFDGNWNQDPAHAVREGSLYYLAGAPALLDAPGEWCLDGRSEVKLWTPESDDPSRRRVEVKRRDLAFDLGGRAHVNLQGFRIFAATISLADAEHCRVAQCHLRHASHFAQCDGWGTQIHSGVLISGHDNEFRECSVVYSAGNGVALLGEHNAVRNCLIRNVDYMAVDCGAIWAEGARNVIVGNTLCEAGRSALVHRTLKASLIAYNDMYHAGLLTSDLGITYCYATDGAGTVIAYNRVHHNQARATGVGIYIDNASSNFIIHHNVSYSNPDSGIRLNTPSHDNLVFNNTVVSSGNSLGYWGAEDNKDQAGCRVVNNIFTDAVTTGDGIEVSHNFLGKDPGFVNANEADFRLLPGSPCVGAGMALPGITRRPGGKAPDLGAFEFGRPAWTAGHDWGEPPVF